MTLRQRDSQDGARGQVLVLFALMLIVLLAVTALAIDVSNAYAARRFYRAVADASALAGAQDLQTTTSRAVTSTDYANGRRDALQLLIDRLGGSGPPPAGPCNANTTDYSQDFADCALPGTPYRFSIKTDPSPTCINCDPYHAIQVTVRNPSFSLSFARVFGIDSWNVGITSVAGLTFEPEYALITLRPPDVLPNSLDQNRKDVNLAGTNTRVSVLAGDVGTNSYVATNSDSYLALAKDYYIDHYDNITPDGWNKVNGLPVGMWMPTLIPDPMYTYPTQPTNPASVYSSTSAGLDGTVGGSGSCVDAPTGSDALPNGTQCYKPGVYQQVFNLPGTVTNIYLEPGVFFFNDGLVVGSGQSLLGGLVSGHEGVAIVVPEGQGMLSGASANAIDLNGGASTCQAQGCRASPALDLNGDPVVTPDGLTLTIMVRRDSNCFNGTTPILCSDNQNNAVSLGGNASLIVAGVIYAPSDNVKIDSNFTSQYGYVGQIISWTVTYTGGSALNQSYPGGKQIGIVRLDAACTSPATTSASCNP